MVIIEGVSFFFLIFTVKVKVSSGSVAFTCGSSSLQILQRKNGDM